MNECYTMKMEQPDYAHFVLLKNHKTRIEELKTIKITFWHWFNMGKIVNASSSLH